MLPCTIATAGHRTSRPACSTSHEWPLLACPKPELTCCRAPRRAPNRASPSPLEHSHCPVVPVLCQLAVAVNLHEDVLVLVQCGHLMPRHSRPLGLQTEGRQLPQPQLCTGKPPCAVALSMQGSRSDQSDEHQRRRLAAATGCGLSGGQAARQAAASHCRQHTAALEQEVSRHNTLWPSPGRTGPHRAARHSLQANELRHLDIIQFSCRSKPWLYEPELLLLCCRGHTPGSKEWLWSGPALGAACPSASRPHGAA